MTARAGEWFSLRTLPSHNPIVSRGSLSHHANSGRLRTCGILCLGRGFEIQSESEFHASSVPISGGACRTRVVPKLTQLSPADIDNPLKTEIHLSTMVVKLKTPVFQTSEHVAHFGQIWLLESTENSPWTLKNTSRCQSSVTESFLLWFVPYTSAF